ncbi:MAG: tyrosinase family protein [Fuerstiella sp.]|nr:tyrosinase family protein [Fuerstiella sp.]
MTRFIAILTLALTAALSADEAFAVKNKTLDQYVFTGADLYSPDTVDGIIAIIALAATETGIIDPADCPQIMDPNDCPDVLDPSTSNLHHCFVDFIVDPNDCPRVVDPVDCPDLVDLWFELVDAGYTEDEAFEMIEMVMGNDSAFSSHHANIDTVWAEWQ